MSQPTSLPSWRRRSAGARAAARAVAVFVSVMLMAWSATACRQAPSKVEGAAVVESLDNFDGVIKPLMPTFPGADAGGVSVEALGDRRTYVAGRLFEHGRGAHDVCTVTVAFAGTLLEPQMATATTDLTAGGLHIGLRAVSEPGGMGPGGASSALVFTTSDGRYDVRVARSQLLPDDVAPDVRCEPMLLGAKISNRYDEHSRR